MSDWSDRFEVIEELGSGGGGRVWLARDALLQREVALKEVAGGGTALTEARAAARLSHPSIVTIHDVLEDDGVVRIAMEFLDGPTLAEVIAKAGGQDPAAVRAVVGQVAGALAAAHAAGMTHGDVKPSNIFWLASGRVVVADFGLARTDDIQQTRTVDGFGSPAYLSPEQVRGERTTAASDVFSWGVVAYELLTGTHPFGAGPGVATATILYRIAHEDPAPLLTADTALAEVIGECLAKDPLDRPSSGSEVCDLLTGAVMPAGRRPSTVARRADDGRPRQRDPIWGWRLAATIALWLLAVTAGALLVATVSSGGLGGDIESAPLAGDTSNATSTTGGPTTTTVMFHRVNADGATVYERPRATASELSTLPAGSLLPGDGVQQTDRAGTNWLHVKDAHSSDWGWVKAFEVSPA